MPEPGGAPEVSVSGSGGSGGKSTAVQRPGGRISQIIRVSLLVAMVLVGPAVAFPISVAVPFAVTQLLMVTVSAGVWSMWIRTRAEPGAVACWRSYRIRESRWR